MGCRRRPHLEENVPVQKQQSPMRSELLLIPRAGTRQERLLAKAPFSKMVVVCPSEMEAAIKVTAMVVLFLLVVLMLFGLRSYVHMADEWAGTSCMILGCPGGLSKGRHSTQVCQEDAVRLQRIGRK